MQYGIIYKLTNTVNGKSYIGKTTRPKERKVSHFNGHSACPALQSAITKYGKDVFEWHVLHKNVPEPCLSALEMIEIVRHKTLAKNGYNLTKGGDGCKASPETTRKIANANRGKKRTPEQRKRMSDAHKGIGKGVPKSKEHRENLSKASKGKPGTNTGKKFTAEHRAKISKSSKGKKMSLEARAKMSKAKKGRPPWNKGKRLGKKRNPNQLSLF